MEADIAVGPQRLLTVFSWLMCSCACCCLVRFVQDWQNMYKQEGAEACLTGLRTALGRSCPSQAAT